MKTSILLTAMCFLFSTTLSAQIFDRVFTEQLRLWKTIELTDGSLVSIGSAAQNTAVVIKTNRNGGLIATKSLGAGVPNDLQLVGAIYAVVGAKVMRINPDLTTAWSVTPTGNFFKRIRPLSNGNLLMLSERSGDGVWMLILNPQTGAIISQKRIVEDAIATRLPEFTVVKNTIYALVNDEIWTFSLAGDYIRKLSFGMENLFDISTTNDQKLLVSRGESILFKLDTSGAQIWRRDIWHKSWSNANSNGVLVVNELNPGRSSGEVSLIDSDGQLKWIRPIGEKQGELPFQARSGLQTSDGNMVVVGNTYVPSDSFRTVRSRMVKLGNDNQMYVNRIVGNLNMTRNSNCKKDASDRPRAYWLMSARDASGADYWGLTDSMGRYVIRCDTGIYSIKAMDFKLSEYLVLSSCNAQSKRFVGYGKTDTVDLIQNVKDTFGVTTSTTCTALKVDIGAPNFRSCTPAVIDVFYENKGNTFAYNTSIAVELDTLVAFVNATIPLANRIANKFYFNIGVLEAGYRGSFSILVRTKCPDTTRLGQNICVKARIFADTSCVNTSRWTGAELSVEGKCKTDSVVFKITNSSNTPSQNRKAVIIENNDIKTIGSIQLIGSQSTTRSFPANGNTWRLTLEQEPYHPTSFAPTAFVEGCGGNSNQNLALSYVNNFASDDRALSVSNVCRVLGTSYDPNDKTGYPLGYGDKHFIDQNQDIDYMIRFQNTGNDTAFKVVIRDTIDTRFLDLGSIEFGASSHVYEPTVYDKNILQFTFDNILLVDSFRNEPASNGYVKFRIKQKKDVSIGSEINNSSAIYFDFNKPIITNTTQHTVGKPILLTTQLVEINNTSLNIDVSPNPFSTQTVLKIKEKGPLSINAIFELFDVNGRLVRRENMVKNELILDRNNLSNGIYFFKIKTTDGRFNSGKIVIQ